MDLVLIRHPAVGIDAGICYGQSDVPLAYDVAGSARVLDQRMRALKVPACVGAWHTSPLQRCALLADALGASHADPRLMEIDFGAWEGRAWDDIDRALLDAWAGDLEHARAHGGESLAQFSARVGRWFDETCRDGDAPVHVVTHAGVIRVLTARLIEARPASVLQWTLDHGGIVWLRRTRGEWFLVRWNA
ncbi:alpha-ribazole phosphatase [Caballeronia arationis]|uniref:alpha-ribazole phosphatase family protein n=1 Tax=Caballeronia arationis TaxID=1777142 RepID=UPI00074C9B15|nr:alpha-ribazole phosphatase family protein [Caballeronia arationis]SAK62731.1 alpha-ribazole phosphatase [Caballeronia arationis]